MRFLVIAKCADIFSKSVLRSAAGCDETTISEGIDNKNKKFSFTLV